MSGALLHLAGSCRRRQLEDFRKLSQLFRAHLGRQFFSARQRYKLKANLEIYLPR